MTEKWKTIEQGILGTTSSALALITSFQEQIEWWLRVGALILGLTISLLTLLKLLGANIRFFKRKDQP